MNIDARPLATTALPPIPDQESEAGDSAPTPPDQTSGNAVPAPLAREDELRADDVKQSAEALKAATERARSAEKVGVRSGRAVKP